ncbi:MAG: TrkH family potassium uptake protein [Thermodesulfobacteriota bacterium]|nr:TrkH family potassium uptake protein [Thermodesulfobacteriota bacterium]
MRWQSILNIIGVLLLFLGLSMIFPVICSLCFKDQSLVALLQSMGITIVSGLILFFGSKKSTIDYISQREGMAIVAIGWTAIGFFGALPFFIGDVFPLFTDAFFESVSGFTTTGSSVLTDIEGVSKSLLFWRSFIQWLGGMGIIVLSLAILPYLGVGGMQLFKAEVPSPVPDKLAPRLSESAKILWYVYAMISLIEVIALLAGGIGFYDALCHTFTTMPTGGFSTKNTSMAHFNSAYLDYTVLFFMLLAGINFSLHYQLLRGKTLIFWKDSECRFFLFFTFAMVLIVTFNIYGSVYETLGDAFRYASFQIVSIVTTTGYATADYENWPGLSQVIIFICMFIGASAGSTGGGMKCFRIMVCFKYCYRELFTLVHPRSVAEVKINAAVVPDSVLKSIMGFLAIYIGLFVFCSLLVSAMGVDMVTSFSAVASCIGNIGPGFGAVGPAENFACLPCAGKWLLAWCMLLGRLEVYTVIILLVPEFWKK